MRSSLGALNLRLILVCLGLIVLLYFLLSKLFSEEGSHLFLGGSS